MVKYEKVLGSRRTKILKMIKNYLSPDANSIGDRYYWLDDVNEDLTDYEKGGFYPWAADIELRKREFYVDLKTKVVKELIDDGEDVVSSESQLRILNVSLSHLESARVEIKKLGWTGTIADINVIIGIVKRSIKGIIDLIEAERITNAEKFIYVEAAKDEREFILNLINTRLKEAILENYRYFGICPTDIRYTPDIDIQCDIQWCESYEYIREHKWAYYADMISKKVYKRIIRDV